MVTNRACTRAIKSDAMRWQLPLLLLCNLQGTSDLNQQEMPERQWKSDKVKGMPVFNTGASSSLRLSIAYRHCDDKPPGSDSDGTAMDPLQCQCPFAECILQPEHAL